MKIRLVKGQPPREQWEKACPVCGINNLKPFKNAWLVNGFETAPAGPWIGRTKITKSVNIWTCSKLCAEMALLQNM